LFLLVLACSSSSCAFLDRGFRRDAEKERAFQERCLRTMELLPDRPSQPHRVTRIIEENGEDALVETACSEHADAVVSMGFASIIKGRGSASMMPVGNGALAIGGTRTSERLLMRGMLIRYLKPTEQQSSALRPACTNTAAND